MDDDDSGEVDNNDDWSLFFRSVATAEVLVLLVVVAGVLLWRAVAMVLSLRTLEGGASADLVAGAGAPAACSASAAARAADPTEPADRPAGHVERTAEPTESMGRSRERFCPCCCGAPRAAGAVLLAHRGPSLNDVLAVVTPRPPTAAAAPPLASVAGVHAARGGSDMSTGRRLSSFAAISRLWRVVDSRSSRHSCVFEIKIHHTFTVTPGDEKLLKYFCGRNFAPRMAFFCYDNTRRTWLLQ